MESIAVIRIKIKAIKQKHAIISDLKLSRDAVLLESKRGHDYDSLFCLTSVKKIACTKFTCTLCGI